MLPFQYVRPHTIQEATTLLSTNVDNARLLAGGQDLLGSMKQGIQQPELVISLNDLPELAFIREDDRQLTIGALVTLESVAHHPSVRKHFTALAQAAASVGSPQIRHRGTLGGNLCQRPRCWYYRDSFYSTCLKKGGNTCYAIAGRNAYHAIVGGGPCFSVHPSDCAPALLALGASVILQGPDGIREVALENFYVPPSVDVKRETVLNSNEILTEIRIPKQAQVSAYMKFQEREGFDWALVSVAVCLQKSGVRCEKARIVLGGVSPVPWRASEAEKAIEGQEITVDTCSRAGTLAVENALALTDNSGKIPLASTLVQQAIMSLRDQESVVRDFGVY